MDGENVETVRQAVLSQVHAEVREMLEEAEAEVESLRQEAEREAESQHAALLRQARDEAELLREQAVAEARIRAQQVKLSRREDLLDRTFEAAREQLRAAPESPAYPQTVRRLVQEGVKRVGTDEAVIRLDERTQRALGDQLPDLFASLEQELGVRLALGEPVQENTGVVVQTTDGHRRYDNTLEARLARVQETLRAPVYRILRKAES